MISMKEIDFLIIGAAKSATTWLQRSLQADPEVYMPDPELHYFSREYDRGDAWYLAQFTCDGERVVGEKSNSYLDTPEAVRRIARDLSHARLVVQLRNPVDRAYSDYCMFYRRGQVGRDIRRYLDPRGPEQTRILAAGMYSRQLAAYRDHFPSARILVTFYENIRTEPVGQLNQVRNFLGLTPAAAETFVSGKVKDKTVPMINPNIRRWLGPIKPLVAPFRSSAPFRSLHGMLSREIRYAPFPDDLRQRLIEHYAADVEILGKMLGKDLSGWLNGQAVRSGRPPFASATRQVSARGTCVQTEYRKGFY